MQRARQRERRRPRHGSRCSSPGGGDAAADGILEDRPVVNEAGKANNFHPIAGLKPPEIPLARIPVQDGGTVVTIQGPRFSSRAESKWFQDAGWDVINMTAYPEGWLARELGLCYANVSLITDYDVGVEGIEGIEPVTQRPRMDEALARSGLLVVAVDLRLAPETPVRDWLHQLQAQQLELRRYEPFYGKLLKFDVGDGVGHSEGHRALHRAVEPDHLAAAHRGRDRRGEAVAAERLLDAAPVELDPDQAAAGAVGSAAGRAPAATSR